MAFTRASAALDTKLTQPLVRLLIARISSRRLPQAAQWAHSGKGRAVPAGALEQSAPLLIGDAVLRRNDHYQLPTPREIGWVLVGWFIFWDFGRTIFVTLLQ
jgi:hypothetical protein